ncbi:DUF2007 domain-containing protein [bacterium]|nr:DUF2007 domain-containing protein [bacterium]
MIENVGGARPDHDEDLAVAYVASGEMEALTVKSVLEAAGIESTLKMEAMTKLLAMTIDGLGAVEVLVPAKRLEEARTILDTPAEVVEDPDGRPSDGGNS